MTTSLLPTEQDIQYQLQHIHESRQHEVVASITTVLTLASIAVILRLVARRLTKAPLQKDDYMILAALIMATGYSGVLYEIVHLGGMKHVITMKHPITVAKLIIAAEAFYNPAIGFVKLSYLMLYHRLFPTRGIRIACWTTGTIIVIYTIIGFFCDIFVCKPIRAGWDPTVTNATCININLEYVIFAIFNVITDVIVLVLPLPVLWRLHLSQGRKFQLMGIFLTGGFVCIVSIYRVPQMKLVREDASYVDVPAAIWSGVEICVGIVSACLPTLRPIVTYVSNSVKERKTWNSRTSSSFARTDLESTQTFNREKVRTPDPVHFYYPDSTIDSRPLPTKNPPKKDVIIGGALGAFFPRAGKIEQQKEEEV